MKNLIKRLMDIFISSMAILIFSPFFIAIAIALKIDSKGPVFYKHSRVGKNGKIFTCYKFRSMYVGVDPNKLVSDSNDDRVTLVGKFMRSSSLDELPQLINVFLGAMSIVGPRPALPSQVEQFTKEEKDKLLVKPGLTGWTQVNGRNSIPYSKRMELDCWYAKNWNIFLDINIILKTFIVVLRRDGIYDAK